MTCQAGPGLAPTTAPPTLLSPFISQTAALPSSFCQRMSAVPLPLKSPAIFAGREPPGLCPDAVSSTAILMCQAGPGLAPTTALFKTLAPSSSQTAARPSSFCQIMSDLPSPLTSSAPLTCPVDAPACRAATIALPKDVGLAVAVAIAGALHVPGRARIAANYGAGDLRGSVHQPDSGAPVVVLPQDVRLLVGVEIAGILH